MKEGAMAEFTPWQLTRRPEVTTRKKEVFARDLYNFSGRSETQGANNPKVGIPSMGPHAAGAIPPTKYPTVVATEVITTGTLGTEYGNNL
jgi:hypothetical protein